MLKHSQEDSGEPLKYVRISVWQLDFQVGGERVSMQQGSLSVRSIAELISSCANRVSLKAPLTPRA
ncbi:hypothetical protein GCM10010840_16280 [Deinococcus aerolatus]|uniref:Uncharacterized protein n=1 Tax=Deinococcus aerolatus TaxID=522487 RepID=A0ABQ2G7M9_9DEIO|nr:hypothetical protein [Deinococcus aerolatus]GGL79180.1 hypothetical protein GCM10010840_16280 [Deinococcus aerolatus]